MSYLIWIQLTSAYNKTHKSFFSVSLIALCEIIRKLILVNYLSPCNNDYQGYRYPSQTRNYINFGVCVLLIGIACGILFAFNLNLEDAIFEDNNEFILSFGDAYLNVVNNDNLMKLYMEKNI